MPPTVNRKRRKNHKRTSELQVVWPIFDTMAQASARSGLPLAMFRVAKRDGCEAFLHSRVYFGEFLKWWGARGDDDASEDWGKELKKEQTLRARQLRGKEAGELLDSDLVSDAISRAMAAMFSELDKAFVDLAPAADKGKDEVALRDAAIARIEALKVTFRARLSGPDIFGEQPTNEGTST